MQLSVLCVTRGGKQPLLDRMHAMARRLGAEFVVAVDGGINVHLDRLDPGEKVLVVPVHSAGYVESVLDQAVEACAGEYVLRLDDDEAMTPAGEEWLRQGRYLAEDHWKFPRAWLWGEQGRPLPLGSPQSMVRLANPIFWPDEQTRLSVKAKAAGRRTIHAGSPFGGGKAAPVAIEHHKFLIQTKAQRIERVREYDRLQQGSGTAFRGFYVPEELPGGPICVEWDGGLKHRAACALALARESGFQVFQYDEEITSFAAWALARGQVRTVLEIGSCLGGTAAFWCELADRVISVDLPGGPFSGQPTEVVESWVARLSKQYPSFRSVLGDSHDKATLARVRQLLKNEKVDLLFIDGDHKVEGVRSDFETYGPLVRKDGAIGFHDIVDTQFVRDQGCEVSEFWSEVLGRAAAEFKVPGGDYGGIGVLTR